MFEKIVMLISQLATCIMAWWMFYSILENDKEKKWLASLGMIVYVLLPYHRNVVRQGESRMQILIWILVPFMAVMLIHMKKVIMLPGKLCCGIMAAASIGIIGRRDGIAYLILLFLLTVAGICEKQWSYPLTGLAGMILSYPTFYVWKYWLFDGNFAQSGLEYTSIMERGYSIGGLFSTYFHRDGNPGMGILLMAIIGTLLYAAFVKNISFLQKEDFFWLGAVALLTILSLRYFPWDFVQRLGIWAVGFVTLIRTPAVFFGYAQMVLCVWGVKKCSVVLQAVKEERFETDKGHEEICKVEENEQDMAG